MKLDLLSLSSVRCFAEEWNSRGRPLHLLINNAGIFYMKARKLFEKKITSIQCIAVNPGIANTNMVKQQQHTTAEWKLFWMFSPAEGARSVLYCSTSPSVAENLNEGFAYYSSHCTRAKESLQAMNVNACLNVWKKTIQILDLDVDYLSQIIDC
ncbi:hypothetical protein J5N97_028333 [Dioscorea zingiberensis]|uniref:Uncharacterized protein n=1 Tax=Dioscorea zingiberensis TaxID=325984 RepID=A0A9D5H4Q9_9LILI|nr:hypothetical protein J5N97_028333 [Dioscorea zingiberensis]